MLHSTWSKGACRKDQETGASFSHKGTQSLSLYDDLPREKRKTAGIGRFSYTPLFFLSLCSLEGRERLKCACEKIASAITCAILSCCFNMLKREEGFGSCKDGCFTLGDWFSPWTTSCQPVFTSMGIQLRVLLLLLLVLCNFFNAENSACW